MKKARDALNSAQDFLNSPRSKRVSAFGKKALDLASTLSQAKLKGPVGILGTALGAFDVLTDVAKEDTDSFMRRTGSALGMERGSFNRHKVLKYAICTSDLLEKGEVIFGDSMDDVVVITFDNGEKIMLEIPRSRTEGKVNIRPIFYVSSKEKVIDCVVKDFWGNLGTDFVTVELDSNNEAIIVPISPPDEKAASGYNSKVSMANKVKKYREKMVNRSFLLIGPPGTGKTTFCFSVAGLVGGKTLVLKPRTFDNISNSAFEALVTSLKCDFLILEDIDRTENGRMLLSSIETVKRANPNLTIFSSANNPDNIIDALKRPGRLGERVYFKAPDLEERISVIKLYSEKYGVCRDITPLAKEMEHKLYSHDYVRDACEMALVCDDDELTKYIKDTISDLSAEGGE